MSSTLQILEEHFGRHPPTVLILQWHLPRHFIYKREKQLILDSLIQQQQGNLWTWRQGAKEGPLKEQRGHLSASSGVNKGITWEVPRVVLSPPNNVCLTNVDLEQIKDSTVSLLPGHQLEMCLSGYNALNFCISCTHLPDPEVRLRALCNSQRQHRHCSAQHQAAAVWFGISQKNKNFNSLKKSM